MKPCRLVSILVYVFLAGAQDATLPKSMTVCDLLRDPAKYNGKVIAVRGTYLIGGHGLYLHGEGCDGVLTTKGHPWPPIIWLSLSQQEMEQHGQSFDRALKAEDQVSAAREREKQFRRDRGSPGRERVTLTYIGLFETRDNLENEVGRAPNGTTVVNGFGPGNSAPGQLYVQSVKDIVVEFEATR